VLLRRDVLITLAEKGAAASFTTIDLFEREQRTEAHLRRHPFGLVPVLEDDGHFLYESRAIIRYLDARLGGMRLSPSSPHEFALMEQWMSVDQSYIAPHTRTLAEERILKKREGRAPDAGAVLAAETALAQAFSVLNAALAEGAPFLAGPSFSLADVSLMPHVASLPMIGAEGLLEGVPALAQWWSRVSARPSWAQALSWQGGSREVNPRAPGGS
jgi:glutathione S-transferase